MLEHQLIETYLAPLAHPEFGLNLRDDAALVDVPEGYQLCISTDTLNAHVHFIGNEHPALIAQKALRVNLSDLAAMGATPLAYTLNLACHNGPSELLFKGFAEGLQKAQEEFGIHLIGGDTTATKGQTSITVTVYGLVKKGQALRMNGAHVGDAIYVSGTIGEAGYGLRIAKQAYPENPAWLQRYQLPEPRLELSQALIGKATACTDISDGMMFDLAAMLDHSGVGAEVSLHSIPVCDPDALDFCLSAGDDYELVFTAPPDLVLEADVPITRIGRIIEEPELFCFDADGKLVMMKADGYQH